MPLSREPSRKYRLGARGKLNEQYPHWRRAWLVGSPCHRRFGHAQPVPTPRQACLGGTGCAASACPTSITPAQATLPLAACPINGETQSAVDIFSWNEFIALNWPATTACAADQAKSILSFKSGDQGRRYGRRYSNTAINKQTAKKPFTEFKPNSAPIKLPVPIKRDIPIAANPDSNAYYQNLLAG